MPTITCRFYADLNNFLPYDRRGVAFTHHLEEAASSKDVVESLGIPHTEVGLLLRNGVSVGFDTLIQDGDRVSVYPFFTSLEVADLSQVQLPAPEPRFVLDIHLGKLATYLRLLGFDALFPENYDDANLARISAEEGRIMLSRDRGLLKRGNVTHGYHPRSTNPREQLIEVLKRYDLAEQTRPFTRCLRCNGPLVDVDKAAVADALEPGTLRYYDEFRRCTECGQVYWRGTHYQRLVEFVEAALHENGRGD